MHIGIGLPATIPGHPRPADPRMGSRSRAGPASRRGDWLDVCSGREPAGSVVTGTHLIVRRPLRRYPRMACW